MISYYIMLVLWHENDNLKCSVEICFCEHEEFNAGKKIV